MSLETLDIVRLRVPSGEWDAGTEGTVLELFDDTVLVEVSDKDGRTRDLLSLPRNAVERVAPQQQERLPV